MHNRFYALWKEIGLCPIQVECSCGVGREGFKEGFVHLFTFRNTSNTGFFITIFYLTVFKATFFECANFSRC